MVSVQKYSAIIKKFLDKYEKVMGKNISTDLTAVWLWIKEYNQNMGEKVPVEDRKLYVKRGANLWIRFVDSYTEESTDMKDRLLKCRLSILRGEKICSDKTKNELTALVKEYNQFAQAMIGCNDKSTDFFLNLIQRTAQILGEDYLKIKDKLEQKCLSLRVELLQD